MEEERKWRLGTKKWRANLQAMKIRLKERVRVAAGSYDWRRQRQGMSCKALKATAATTGGLVVARVFKGNVVFSRLIHRGPAAFELRDVFTGEWVSSFARLSDAFPRFPLLFRQSHVSTENTSSFPKLEEISIRPNLGFFNLEDSKVVRMLQRVAVPFLGNVCHAFMNSLNSTEVHGAEKLEEAIKGRPQGQPLITVSNHVASVDDPLVVSSVVPTYLLSDARLLRWTLCATDRCFTNPIISTFFRSVKVLPVSRGEGVFQKGMDMALAKLNQGDWVHIFPEGSRSRDGGRTIGAAKRGVGRLVLDSAKPPLVVPFVHAGMQEVMPIGSKFPHVSKKIVVLVGDPINVEDLIARKEQFTSDMELYDAISLRIGERLKDLKSELDELVRWQSLLNRNIVHLQTIKLTDSISHFVDWEANNLFSQVVTESETETSSLLDESMLKCNKEPHNHLKLPYDSPSHLETLVNNSNRSSYPNDTGCNNGVVSTLNALNDPSHLMGFAAKRLVLNEKNSFDRNISLQSYRDNMRSMFWEWWVGKSKPHPASVSEMKISFIT